MSDERQNTGRGRGLFMLTEERHAAILRLLETKKAVTVVELTHLLDTSESTIRRDLVSLDRIGKLNKVHGGATAIADSYGAEEAEVELKYTLNMKEKRKIASRAAQLVSKNDFVYFDAGTTTEMVADYLSNHNAVYVTNGIVLARKLAKAGFQVYILPGKVKARTEAVIGAEAMEGLKKYHFTIGFFGTNGVSLKEGYSTPDIEEAMVKREALSRCRRGYILTDPTKVGKVSSVSFGKLSDASIITTCLSDKQFKSHTNVVEVEG